MKPIRTPNGIPLDGLYDKKGFVEYLKKEIGENNIIYNNEIKDYRQIYINGGCPEKLIELISPTLIGII